MVTRVIVCANGIRSVIVLPEFVLEVCWSHCFTVTTKVDRGYIGATDCLAKKPREKDFQSKIVNWLYSFTNDIETEEQEKDSLEQLSMFIDVSEEEGVNRSLVTATRKFIRESFKPYLPLLCQRHFNDIYCGNVNENCFTESDNASMKKDSMGPEANSQLHISTSAIVGHTERRTGKLEREALKEARKSRQGKASDNEVLKCKTDISKKIVFQKCDDICDQFDLSSGEIFSWSCYLISACSIRHILTHWLCDRLFVSSRPGGQVAVGLPCKKANHRG